MVKLTDFKKWLEKMTEKYFNEIDADWEFSDIDDAATDFYEFLVDNYPDNLTVGE